MIRILGLKLINILTSGDETEEISLPLFLISAFKCYDLKQVDVNSTSDERRALFVPFEHYKYKKTWLIWSNKKKTVKYSYIIFWLDLHAFIKNISNLFLFFFTKPELIKIQISVCTLKQKFFGHISKSVSSYN